MATGVKGYSNWVTLVYQVMRPQGPLVSLNVLKFEKQQIFLWK